MKRNQIRDYLDVLQSRGRYFFTLQEVDRELGLDSRRVARALQGLTSKGLIAHVRRGGSYVIVPPEYRATGVLPPDWFIDDLMRSIERSYYVGVLSAAALHGASHQQSQTFHVVSSQASRDLVIKDLHIRLFLPNNQC